MKSSNHTETNCGIQIYFFNHLLLSLLLVHPRDSKNVDRRLLPWPSFLIRFRHCYESGVSYYSVSSTDVTGPSLVP